MKEINFDSIPEKVHQNSEKLDHILRLLLENSQVQQPEKDRWFDIDALCDYLPDKPAKSTVYLKLAKRELPGHKKSKKWYFLKSEIDLWLQESKAKSKAETQQSVENFLVSKGRRAQR